MRTWREPWKPSERISLLAISLIGILAAAPHPPAGNGPDPCRGDDETTRSELVRLINLERAERDALPLSADPSLCRMAQARADEIAAAGHLPIFSEKDTLARAVRAGYEARVVSEVIGQAEGDVEELLESWRKSGSATYADLIAKRYRHLGLGLNWLDDVPLYVIVFGLSWSDFFEQRRTELSDTEKIREDLARRVNAERAAKRLPALRGDPSLDRAAQNHAEDMLARSYYGHRSLEGLTVFERALNAGYQPRFAGENIARGQYAAEEVMKGWMASAEHREHILAARFSELGSGFAIGKNENGYQVIWVQVFGRPKERR